MSCVLVNDEAYILILKDYVCRENDPDKICRGKPVDICDRPVFFRILNNGRNRCLDNGRFSYYIGSITINAVRIIVISLLFSLTGSLLKSVHIRLET